MHTGEIEYTHLNGKIGPFKNFTKLIRYKIYNPYNHIWYMGIHVSTCMWARQQWEVL